MIYRALPVIAAVCILGGCGEEPRADRAPFSYGMEAPTGDERRALASMAALEADLAQAGSLQGDERIEAERRLGPVVAKNADLCVGTRLENKGWYLLASWRFQFVNETADLRPSTAWTVAAHRSSSRPVATCGSKSCAARAA